MKSKILGLLAATALSVVMGQTAQAQDILLGNLSAGAGPFATLAKTNEIAAQMAVEEINAAGGVGGKKLKIISFDTAGKATSRLAGWQQERLQTVAGVGDDERPACGRGVAEQLHRDRAVLCRAGVAEVELTGWDNEHARRCGAGA